MAPQAGGDQQDSDGTIYDREPTEGAGLLTGRESRLAAAGGARVVCSPRANQPTLGLLARLTLAAALLLAASAIIIVFTGFATLPPAPPDPAFAFEDIFNYSLAPKYVAGQWISAPERMAAMRDGGIQVYTPATSSWSILVPAHVYALMNASAWEVSPSGKYVLFRSNAIALYRHSRTSEYQVFDVAEQRSFPLDITAPQQAARWVKQPGLAAGSTPPATAAEVAVAYVQGHNIYLRTVGESQQARRVAVTSDGTADGVIRSGIADWVTRRRSSAAAPLSGPHPAQPSASPTFASTTALSVAMI